MFFKVVFLVVVASVFAEEQFEYSQRARNCIAELGTSEEAVRRVVPEKEPVPEDNELAQKFLACCFKNVISESNELLADNEDFHEYMTNTIAIRMDGRRKLAKLVAEDCIKHCRDIKGDSKGRTAIRTLNCMKNRFQDIVAKN